MLFHEKLTSPSFNSSYHYDIQSISESCQNVSDFHSEFFQSRYAMKANSNSTIMKVMCEHDIWVDCCSEYEILTAIKNGFSPYHIQLSSQQSPKSWKEVSDSGVSCIATSLHQLESFAKECSGKNIGIRINPGQGSGQFAKINTGGKQSSFGIRHEYKDRIFDISQKYALCIEKIHIHIGSGSDTKVWLDTLQLCLETVEKFSEVSVLNMGGGFKVARMPGEKTTDLPVIIKQSLAIISEWSLKHNRKLKLEIEPGTYYVAQHGYIQARVDDVVDTGKNGFQFLRTNTGMDMIIRPAMYGAQHPIYHYSQKNKKRSQEGDHHYVIVGHCCESSDLLSPEKNNPDKVSTRGFDQKVQIGDTIVIGGAGAYCESMRCVGYNGY